jgi:tetratricopeptide (TPR) repeat protein
MSSDETIKKLEEGNEKLDSGEYEIAIKIFNDVLEIDPRNEDAFYLMGNAYLNLQEFYKAIKCYDEALKLNPEDFDAINNKGVALIDLEDMKKALTCFDKALKIEPNLDYAGFNKAIIYKDMKKPKKALTCFKKALKINPEYAETFFELGNVLKDIGKSRESIEAYKDFVKIVRKNKISELYLKARRVSDYLNWIDESGKRVTFSPKDKPRYWQWVTKAEYFLDEDGSEREVLEPWSLVDPGRWWTCHKDTLAGDLALIYRAGEEDGVIYRDIKYLVMARSDAYPLNSKETAGETNWHYGCDFLPLFKFNNSLKIDEMRNDPYLDEWNALRKRFQGIVFKTEESVWKHLNEILSEKNHDYNEYLETFDRDGIMAKIIDELKVEEELSKNFHLMKDFGYELEFETRQKACIGDGGFIDILAKDKNTSDYVVIELKIVKADRCTFGQISSYIGWVKENESNGQPVKGIVISRGYDNKFRSALKTNPNIYHIELADVLSKLGMKLE